MSVTAPCPRVSDEKKKLTFVCIFIKKKTHVQVLIKLNREPRETRGWARRCNPALFCFEKGTLLAFVYHYPAFRLLSTDWEGR
jgi:hypothetical protein